MEGDIGGYIHRLGLHILYVVININSFAHLTLIKSYHIVFRLLVPIRLPFILSNFKSTLQQTSLIEHCTIKTATIATRTMKLANGLVFIFAALTAAAPFNANPEIGSLIKILLLRFMHI